MNIEEWCAIAQRDQMDDKKSLLYGNFRHSAMDGLITKTALGSFADGLTSLRSAVLKASIAPKDLDYGLANVAAGRALWAIYKPSIPTIDFRMTGPNVAFTEHLINVEYRSSTPPRLSATAAIPSPPPRPASVTPTTGPRPYRVVWLTTVTEVQNTLRQAAARKPSGKLTQVEFFGELVSLLGLRQDRSSPDAACKLVLYKAADGKLRRPHALSLGYPERFCGDSAYLPFGSTADNRSGEAGLPEAVAFHSDLAEIAPDATEYMVLRRQLSKLTTFLRAGQKGWIAGQFAASELHRHDHPSAFRSTVLKRLGKANPSTRCTRPGGSDCACATVV